MQQNMVNAFLSWACVCERESKKQERVNNYNCLHNPLGLETFHNLRSEVETLHLDAVKEWGKIVEAAQESDVIFNCIDYGT